MKIDNEFFDKEAQEIIEAALETAEYGE